MQYPGDQRPKDEMREVFHICITVQSSGVAEARFGLPYFAISQV
jgi:hypothetical protein